MTKLRKAALIGSLLLAISAPHALADNLPPPSFSDKDSDEFFWLGIEHFAWDEYNDDHGNQLGNWVSEFGARLHWGHAYGTDWLRDSGGYYRSTQDFHAGLVRYHGGIIGEPDYELKGHVLHVGYDYSRKMGYRWRLSPQLSLGPTATLGIDAWSRGMIPKRVTHPATGEEERVGFHELFVAPYATLGLSASWHLDSQRRLTLDAGKQRPLMVMEYHNEAGLLYPEPSWNDTLALEYSNRAQEGNFVRLYYQDKVYEASDLNDKGWFQPESHETTIGLMLGWKL